MHENKIKNRKLAWKIISSNHPLVRPGRHKVGLQYKSISHVTLVLIKVTLLFTCLLERVWRMKWT